MAAPTAFRGGFWLAIVVVVIAVGGLFVVRYIHDGAAADRGAAPSATQSN